MKRNKEQKAEVLHAVGDGYFYSEQYDTAGKYYEEALSCDSRNSLYVRDYMTAMARNGSPVDVWTIQSEYPEAAIDEAATVFVQAQSMYAKGDQKRRGFFMRRSAWKKYGCRVECTNLSAGSRIIS